MGKRVQKPMFFLLALGLALEARANHAEFALDFWGGEMASGVLEYGEADRCFGRALEAASTDAERALGLAGEAKARLNQGSLKGVKDLLDEARLLAGRGNDQTALVWAYSQSAEYFLRSGRVKEAEDANHRAFTAAASKPMHSADLVDQLYLQRAAVLTARKQPGQAADFLEQSWVTWAFNPDYLYNTSLECLALGLSVYLDMRRVDKALILGSIYASRSALLVRPCPDPMLKSEWGVAQACRLLHRRKAARIFYQHARDRHASIFGASDEGTRRLNNLALSPELKGLE